MGPDIAAGLQGIEHAMTRVGVCFVKRQDGPPARALAGCLHGVADL